MNGSERSPGLPYPTPCVNALMNIAIVASPTSLLSPHPLPHYSVSPHLVSPAVAAGPIAYMRVVPRAGLTLTTEHGIDPRRDPCHIF